MLRHALRAYYKLMYSTGDFFCVSTILLHNPSLNTQSCIRGLSVVWDFCFLAVWAAGPVLKKKLGPIMSNF